MVTQKNVLQTFILFLISVFSFQTGTAQNNIKGTFLLKNRFRADNYINVQKGKLAGSDIGEDTNSGLWEMVPLDGPFFRLKKYGAKDQYLHTENGPIECSNVPGGYWTSHWKLVPVAGGYYRIENRFRKGQVLHSESGPLESSKVPVGYWTSHWQIKKVAPKKEKVSPPAPTGPMVMQSSVVILRTHDNQYVTRPTFIKNPKSFVPSLNTIRNTANLRIAGHFTFAKKSSKSLKSGDNVPIAFIEDRLMKNWKNRDYAIVKDKGWFQKRYLKAGSRSTAGVPSQVHFSTEGAWTGWVIKKVGGKNGDPIYSKDEVYIYSPATNKYLRPDRDGYLYVASSNTINRGQRDNKFIFRLQVLENQSGLR